MKLSLLLLIVSAFLFSSCWKRADRYVYASQAANINYFKQKGDSKITGYYSGDGEDKDGGFNIQAGYAFNNHLALMAAYTHQQENQTYGYDSVRFHGNVLTGIIETNIFDSSVIHYKRNTFEIGAGYFFSLNRRKTVTFNVYPGVSLENFLMADAGLDSNNSKYTRSYQGRVTKYFVQSSFNIMPSAFFHLSAGGKISFLHFHANNTSYAGSELNYFYLDKINHKTFPSWEPFLNMQISPSKYNWIKVDGQLSFTSELNPGYPKVKIFNGSIGLTIEISPLIKDLKR
jgi:hypothetical protein